MKRKKPKFLKKDWHKMIKLGSQVKKKRKWRAAKGRHNKIRLERRGQQARPKIGWGAEKNRRIENIKIKRIENLKELETTKNQGIIIGKVGLKKRKEIIAKANERKIKILNKYKVKENATN
jgi:ribosomal protein L32E